MTYRIKAIVLLILFFSCAAQLSANQKSSQPQNKVEFRLAEANPADGLTEATMKDKGEKIYLHKEIVVTCADIQEASVIESSVTGEFDIKIQFTEEGARKISEATAKHLGRPLAILVDGQVVVAPRIIQMLKDRSQISGGFTKKEAESLARAFNSK
jgi:preprotein translocase subunit SecD